MKKIKILCSVLAVSIFFVFFAFSVGVNGAWHYAMGASGEIEVPMDVMVFPWVGADQLPGDIETEHHKKLIQNILNGTYQDTNGKVVNIGLNNPDSYISNEINTRTNGNFLFSSDTLGSMDYWERNDISKYFDTETTGLTFLLHFPKNNPNEYHLYTTSMHLGESTPNIPIGETIYPIYRTVLQKNEEGVWEAVQTNTGYATSSYYQNPITGSWLVKYPSFDPNSWVEGELGTSADNAVYAFVGMTATAYNNDAQTTRYYKITTSSATNVKVNSEQVCNLKVYNANMNLVNVQSGAQGTNNLTFRSTRNSTYYIAVSGATSVTFSIT